MSPLHVGASCSALTPSDVLRLAPITPNSLPLLQLAPAHFQLTPLAPACSSSLPACFQWAINSLICIGVPTTSAGQGARGQGGRKLRVSWRELEQAGASWSELKHFGRARVEVLANGHRGVCYQLLTTCGGKFSGAHHLFYTKGYSPHSQLGPLTPNGVSRGRGLCISMSIYWGPHLLWRQVLKCPPPLLGQISLPSLSSHSPHFQSTERR